MNTGAATRSFEQLKSAYLANAQAGRRTFDGFTTAEIAAWNRRLMWGENDEAYPGDAEWSRIVD